jgi:serine/threonine-protein kinase
VRQFGKFRLVELLASGGMAEVWRAEMPGAAGFVKEVALKLVRGEHREDDAFTRMFIQEARLASRLDHGNIVHVFELGQVDGHYYLAMELVRGRTLRAVADRCRELGIRFGVARAVHVCAEVARALAYAHRLEVDGRPADLVHRDVSPQNVLLSYEGEVKLADFGIARAAGAEELTRAGTIKGKLAYMAPEQARGEPVDARADVFALGVILWELCTGRRLFARDGDAATLAALLDAAPASPPSAWNESVPPELDAAVLAALERERERRTASAEALATTLAALRLRLAAASPEELDVRGFLRRLWPEGGAGEPRPREATAVMEAPPVPVAAEEVAERTPARAEAVPAPAPSGAEAPTRTMAYPRPFAAAGARRRTASLLALLAFAIAVAVGVLRWGDADRERAARTADGPRRPAAATAPGAAAARDTGGAPPRPRRDPESAPGPGSAPAAPPAAGVAAGKTAPEPAPRSAAADAPAAPSPRGRATLVVDVVPWATVYVNGENVGDTPLTLELGAGAHELRAVHPSHGSARARIDLRAGERRRWSPRLSR